MEWNKIKKMAALGLAGMMLVGAVMTTNAAQVGTEAETKADVTFKAGKLDPDPVDPPGPKDPDETEEPKPGTGGNDQLQIRVPQLDFGEVELSTEDALYPVKAQGLKHNTSGVTRYVPNYMSVEDVRGTFTGWTVELSVKKPFTVVNKTNDTVNETLTGISINFNDNYILDESAETPVVGPNGIIGALKGGTNTVKLDMSATSNKIQVMGAEEKKGQGKYVQYFSDSATLAAGETYNSGIELDIPAGTKIDAAAYRAELSWVISDTPVTP